MQMKRDCDARSRGYRRLERQSGIQGVSWHRQMACWRVSYQDAGRYPDLRSGTIFGCCLYHWPNLKFPSKQEQYQEQETENTNNNNTNKNTWREAFQDGFKVRT